MSDAAQGLREKLDHGGRLTKAEALSLVRNASVHELGTMGLASRTRRHGQKAYYVYNQHLNYTNICANQCRFCAYSKKRGEKGGFTYSAAQAQQYLEKRKDAPVREVHIVGGLNPALPYSYYIDLLRAVKQTRPGARVKAFTAVEIAFLADSYGKSEAAVLEELIQAGLDALPGGGAEVFDPDLRDKLCPEKVSGQRWLDIHRTAHSLGLPTNATMLFG
ncbi:MAG: radical SAM protein, partial [Desulfohalobium sp.]